MVSFQQATLVSNKILRVIQDSGLHFAIHLTPHSSYITIRRKFLSKEALEQSLSENNSEGDPNSDFKYDELKNELSNLQIQNQVLRESCIDLEEHTKQITAEAEAKLENLHNYAEEISKENVKLKSTIVQLIADKFTLSDKLENASNRIKLKDKEMYNTNKQCENLRETNENKKVENSRLKTDLANLKSSKKKLEKKINKKPKSKTAGTQTDDFVAENVAKLSNVDNSFTEFDITELEDDASFISNSRPFFIFHHH